MKKVSIIIPIYNGENYIERCIESCISQTYDNLEIIAVNDGSIDRTENILQKFCEKYHEKVKVISTSNNGLGLARNNGLAAATGEFILFLDHDDYLNEKAVETCVNHMEQYMLEMLSFDAYIIAEGEKFIYKNNQYDRATKMEAHKVTNGFDFVKNYKNCYIAVTAWSACYKMEFVKKYGLLFDDVRASEDIGFHLKCMINVERIMYIPDKLYTRSYRENSLTTEEVTVEQLIGAIKTGIIIFNKFEYMSEENKSIWFDYINYRILSGMRFVFGRISYKKVQWYREHWKYLSYLAEEFIDLYVELLQKLKIENWINYSLEYIYIMIKGLDLIPKELSEKYENLICRKEEIIIKTMNSIPLNDQNKTIGIYGSGKQAEYILKLYKEHIGNIACKLYYLESQAVSFKNKKEGTEIVNINDAKILNLDMVIIGSLLYEKDMEERTKTVLGDSFIIHKPLERIGEVYPFDERLMALSRSQKGRIVLLNTPEHMNIGDYIITEVELEFFKRYFPNYTVKEITSKEFKEKRFVDDFRITDIICITGGGFVGDLWESGNNVNEILRMFKQNKIVIFPQTVFWIDENNPKPIEELIRHLMECYDVTFCLRDEYSYKKMKAKLGNMIHLELMPDIVLSKNRCENFQSDREEVLVCLREDKESILSADEKKNICDAVIDKYKRYKKISMRSDKKINSENKETIIDNKISEIDSAKLVITDTLHCMILCAVTGTPCIVINNLTGKIKGSYQWISGLGYIYYCENMSDCLEKIKVTDPLSGKYELDYSVYYDKLYGSLQEDKYGISFNCASSI